MKQIQTMNITTLCYYEVGLEIFFGGQKCSFKTGYFCPLAVLNFLKIRIMSINLNICLRISLFNNIKWTLKVLESGNSQNAGSDFFKGETSVEMTIWSHLKSIGLLCL